MWPFSKPPTVGSLSNVAYARWLRAGSPQPLVEFLTYAEDQQETLAGIGDEFAGDRAEALAEEIVAEISAIFEGAGLAPSGAVDGEDAFAEQHALAALQGLQNAPGSTHVKQPRTMGGVTRRREERRVQEQRDHDAPMRMAGIAPDPVPAPEPPVLTDEEAEAALNRPMPDREVAG